MIRLNAYPRPRLVLCVALACVALPRLPPAHGKFELKSPVARGQLALNGFLTGDRQIIEDEHWVPQLFCAPEDECNVCGQTGDTFLPGGKMFIPRVTKFYPNDTKPSVILSIERNFGGYFEFRLCNRRTKGNVKKSFNQDCFDEHVLKIDESRIWYDFNIQDKDTRFYIDRIMEWQTIEIPLLWPTEDFICKKCILQTNYYPAEELTLTGWECAEYEEYAKTQIELFGNKSAFSKSNCAGGRVMRACSDIAVSKHHGKYANKEAIRKWFLNENGTLDYQSNWTIIWPVDEAPRIIGEDTWDTWGYSTPSPDPEFPLVVAECKCNCPKLFD